MPKRSMPWSVRRCERGGVPMRKDFYHKEWYDWRDAVLRYVRFTPDHGAIAKELFAHYEDSVQDFERIGYDEELARTRALAAMGDAVEVGKGLDRAHKPWLGWLFEATKWMMTALALILAVTLVKDWMVREVWYHLEDQLKWQTPPAAADSAETGHGTIYMAPGDVWEEGGLTYQRMDVWLELDVPQASTPWGPRGSESYTTDRGPIPHQFRDEEGNWQESFYYHYAADESFYAMEGYTRYQWSVEFVTEEPLRWVEMTYPFGDWTLRAEWEVEE